MKSLTDFLYFLKREQRKAIAGMAASLGILVGIPMTVIVVYGVGFWNWSPLWAALMLVSVPVLVAWSVQAWYERKIT